MKSKKISQEENSTLLYSVNLETLTINIYDDTQVNHGYDCITSTYENFIVDSETNIEDNYSDEVSFDNNSNILYFKTKDEAFDFVKSQIGM